MEIVAEWLRAKGYKRTLNSLEYEARVTGLKTGNICGCFMLSPREDRGVGMELVDHRMLHG